MYSEVALDGKWTLLGFRPGLGEAGPIASDPAAAGAEVGPLPADVPGDVHTALLAAGNIPDPFYGMNADEVQWVEDLEWWYVRTFTVPDGGLNRRSYLVLDGLDTFADVYLNGHTIGSASNMFVSHKFEVTGVVREDGPNTILVKFTPPKTALSGKETEGLPACFDGPRVYARKMQCSFGWDWTHRLVTCGIWRSARLVSYDQLSVSDLYIQPSMRGQEADAWMQITVENHTQETVKALFAIVLSFEDAREKIELVEEIPPEGATIEAVVRIEEPQLWWPNGMGRQPLYQTMVGLAVEGEVQDVREETFGIRTVELLTADEAGKPAFTFAVNGRKVFAKGANWIPADHFVSRVTEERYRALIELARDANFNMLRVWGGGINEDPAFYRLCDELGIMIWQDFMYSCACYPEDKEFLQEAEREAREVVRTLRNHPSIVLWCGNNENDMNLNADANWSGKRIFREIIPRVVAEQDGLRPYRPSSPFDGEINNSPEEGDWHGGSWFKAFYGDWRNYREAIAREESLFVSEFPAQGPPTIESIERFIPPEQLFPPTLPVWEYHNKDNPHSGRTDGRSHQMILTEFVDRVVCQLRDAAEFARRGGVLQGEFLKAQIEHYRRRKFDTSGCLFWMFDDCWPAISWSVVDYYLRPKVAYYFVRRAFEPVLLSFTKSDDGIDAWITNDTLASVNATLDVGFLTFGQKEFWTESLPISVPPNASVQVWTSDSSYIEVTDPSRQCIFGKLKVDNLVLSRNSYFFDIPKNIKYPNVNLRVSREQLSDDTHRLLISADGYARLVAVSGWSDTARLSDNYFDLLPGETREVLIRGIGGLNAQSLSLQIWG